MLKSNITYTTGFERLQAAGFAGAVFVINLSLLLAVKEPSSIVLWIAIVALAAVAWRIFVVLNEQTLIRFVFDDVDQCSVDGGEYGAISRKTRISPWWVWLVIDVPNIKCQHYTLCTWKLSTACVRSLNFRILRGLHKSS
ncbi:hypothetical protein QTP81_03920 [Alteromonas sp. ASW11-36]|uniref:Uncharacterized protein n=1 Tax=Alteromonas arenosi TaxID=3055817 RepID=A0ABT7SU73_9ALTE|nr:hypothetical protein [Alteromonas sp. ASW11-36]MDM7859751.1 hypothetical protein [Alteromonas sp. ASW11-36]